MSLCSEGFRNNELRIFLYLYGIKNNMKTILLIIVTLISSYSYSFSQELNIGGTIGAGPKNNDFRIVTLGATVEYMPVKSIVSLNTDPVFLFDSKDLMLTVPLYLKLIIGKKIRFCPAFGGFIRTNSNYGWTAGLSIEYKIKEKLLLFVKGDYNMDYWKAEAPTHFGSSYEYIDSGSSIWISLGIKKNILK